MPHHHAPGVEMFLQAAGDLLRSLAGGVVAGHHIPHDDGVFFLQVADLGGADAAVRGAEKAAADHFVGPLDVGKILPVRGGPAAEVAVCVVTHGMAFLFDPVKEGGVLLHLPSQAEEGGFGVMLRQPVQQAGRHLRVGTVIEGEADPVVAGGEAPHQPGPEPVQKPWRMVPEHDQRGC